jgi:hypothetical protein
MLTVLWLYYVEYYRDTVFVIGAHKALISVRSVCTHNPIPPQTALGGLMVGHHYPCARLQGQLSRVLLIALYRSVFMEHLIGIECCERLDLRVVPSLGV